MTKKKKPLTEHGLKVATYKAVSMIVFVFIILLLFWRLGVVEVLGGSWMLLSLIVTICAIQWTVIGCVIYYSGVPHAKTRAKLVGKWLLIFTPAIVSCVVIGISYCLYSGNEGSFFYLVPTNFLLAFVIFLGGAAVGYLLIMGIERLRSKKEHKPHKKAVPKIAEDDPMRYVNNGMSQPSKSDNIIFPDLLSIDRYYRINGFDEVRSADLSLRQLCTAFNVYLENRGMYYVPETIRSFVAGMASSRFIILEGLSGTGKTSLPKYFAEFCGCSTCFTSVQASWKDSSDILGYYNDFTEKFKETPFLRALYEASYTENKINLMVLDEMNLSRVEYYFADFLSVLEFDPDKWKIELMPVSTQGSLPAAFKDGCCVAIPQNTWFVGTCNRDDSTYTITDKVYDRASVIDFAQRNEPTGEKRTVRPISLGSDKLCELFAEAIAAPENAMSQDDTERFRAITDFMLDTFDINFGNRIANQISKYVPVYVACGGSVAKALDLVFSRKILRKLEGRFDDGMKANLTRLEKLIIDKYGKISFSVTLEAIAKLKRKLL